MKILVIGGNGFLGSHLARRLYEKKHVVSVYDSKIRNRYSKIKFIKGNISNKKKLEKAIDGKDVVYNFAAIANLDEALDKPLETVRVNVLVNVMALEACRKAGVNLYIYASTVYVYSRCGGFYRCSKQSSEHYIEVYQNTYGLDFTILRYGSLYGPRSNDKNGLWRSVSYALETGKLRTEGDPEAMREYIQVEDDPSDT